MYKIAGIIMRKPPRGTEQLATAALMMRWTRARLP